MTLDATEHPVPPQPPLGHPFALGLAAIAVFFGGFGLWAVAAPLSSAASAPGVVRVESHRKTIQHLEGGIISAILVKEGQTVRRGAVLLRLDDTQTKASSNVLQGQYAALKALEARLVAERDGAARISFPPELEARRSDPEAAQVLAGQETIFNTRRTSLNGQSGVLDQRVLQLRAEIESYRAQVAAADAQAALIREELKAVRSLLEQGLVSRPRYLALERQLAQLEGVKGQQAGLIARAEQAIGEARLQRTNLASAEAKEVTGELRDVQTKLEEIGQRMLSAGHVQGRTTITAPQAGKVVNLRHVTPGGVIQPGEPILDLVPTGDVLVVDARVSPMDIDSVRPGLKAEVKFTGLKQRRLPILLGEVVSVSADLLTDERTGVGYYTAQVVLPRNEAGTVSKLKLYPGMPADVFIVTGARRPLDYFTDPLRDSFGRAFREE